MVINLREIMKIVSSRWAQGAEALHKVSESGRPVGGPVKKRVIGTRQGQMSKTGSMPDTAFPVGEEGRDF